MPSLSSDEHWAEVDAYIEQVLVNESPALAATRAASSAAGLPAHHVAANQGKLLMLLAQAAGARSVLELGTLGGYSTIWIARALPEDGHLVTLEADPEYARLARRNIAEAGLAQLVNVRSGPALKTLEQLASAGAGPFDMIFLDADKAENASYLPWLLELSRPGTLMIADNIVRGGAIVEVESADPRVQGIRAFFDLVAREPRLLATAVQTVGSKGYDGFFLALVVEAPA
jgi:predicted O-methyltransferase YrrM